MTDNKIGELWRIIRQLVVEEATRTWHELAKRPGGTNPREALSITLHKYGIDPKTYEEKTMMKEKDNDG
jgi:hypothetical protein